MGAGPSITFRKGVGFKGGKRSLGREKYRLVVGGPKKNINGAKLRGGPHQGDLPRVNGSARRLGVGTNWPMGFWCST